MTTEEIILIIDGHTANWENPEKLCAMSNTGKDCHVAITTFEINEPTSPTRTRLKGDILSERYPPKNSETE